MKIGQLTFHASHNYGSVLQAYALSRQLMKMGHETEFINLRPIAQKKAYRTLNKRGIHFWFSLLLYPSIKRRHNEFERFINCMLPLSGAEFQNTAQLREANHVYDAYVCGGDQIWNPSCQDFEPAYFLQFLPMEDRSIKVAYAPSLGKSSFDADTLSNIKEWIQCFDYLSVRESTGRKILQPMTEKTVYEVCDPVLLLSEDDWERLAVKPKYRRPYILVYFLENNHGKRNLISYLKQTLGFEVVLMNEYIRDTIQPFHKACSSSPEEFVGLLMNASFIYTNSLHGTLFATLFEKPFLTAIAEEQEHVSNNNDSRKIDYLQRIGLEDRLYTSGIPNKEFLLHIDYTEARKRIEEFRNASLRYLSMTLK